MNFKQCVLVVATLAITITVSESVYPSHATDILNIMSRSTGEIEQNPSRSLACFGYYIPLIEELVRKYKEDHMACEENSKTKNAQVEAATLNKRNDLASVVDNSCDSLSKCQHIPLAEKVFECYASGGSANANVLKSVSSNASENLFELQEELRIVKNSEYLCTNECSRAYETQNDQALTDLGNCVSGKIEVPTTTTTLASTTTTTTETVVVTKPTEETEVTENPTEIPENPEDSEVTESPLYIEDFEV